MIDSLRQFISFKSIAGDRSGNGAALEFLMARLSGCGFQVQLEGQEHSAQPVLIARRAAVNSTYKVLIYNHYDVEPAEGTWLSGDPFVLSEIDGRLYGRGIADNKGPFWARLEAFENIQKSGAPCPEILWLIQGEEEIKTRANMAVGIFKKHIQSFAADLYVEETGYHDLNKGDQAVFLWSPGVASDSLAAHRHALQPVFEGRKTRFKFEHLIKFASVSPCPLLANIPTTGVYTGFGPNDPTHNIHAPNESLDKERLLDHIPQFARFLAITAELK